jgi:hypothetical protein
MATAASLSSLHHLSSSFLSKTSLTVRPLRTIICSLSSSPSSSSSLQFNISFAPPKPKPTPTPTPKSPEPEPFPDPDALPGGQLFIPWIVRGEDGNLKLQTHPPARLLHAMANAETETKKTNNKNKNKKAKSPENASVEPKYSKAARRFFNQNFKEPAQRLGKVLAAAGGNPIIYQEYPIFTTREELSDYVSVFFIYFFVIISGVEAE